MSLVSVSSYIKPFGVNGVPQHLHCRHVHFNKQCAVICFIGFEGVHHWQRLIFVSEILILAPFTAEYFNAK